MTENELRQYKAMKNEIKDLDQRIQEEREHDIPVICGKVKGSMREFPYIEERISVEMNEPAEAEKSYYRIRKWHKRKDELLKKTAEIEMFVENIEDSDMRQIFRLHAYDKKTHAEIAVLVLLDRSAVSKKIKKYLNLPQNSPNSHF